MSARLAAFAAGMALGFGATVLLVVGARGQGSSTPAPAQVAVCADDRKGLLERLAGAYGEAPVARAVTLTGQLIEITRALDGAWSMVVTAPDGSACVVGAGEAWEAVEPRPFRRPERGS